MDLMKKRWAVLVASVIVNICIGTGFAWSVYQTGLFNEGAVIFGTEVQKSQLALAFTICSGVAPIPMEMCIRDRCGWEESCSARDSYAPALSTA